MATPAPPILASDLYTPGARHFDQTESEGSAESMASLPKLSIGVKAINEALEGGFDFGCIHCITSEPDHDARELLQALLISHLSSASKATATVIDSSLSFDLLALYRALESWLKVSPGISQDATATLERLKIMKVFDCIGLTEAVSEVRDSLDKEPVTDQIEPKAFPKSTIEDSEDEDEMLLGDATLEQAQPPSPPPETEWQPKKHVLVINDISKVISPVIKNNYANGQAVLATLMRSLRHITAQHDLCTVLFSNASNKPATEDDVLSLFGSCTIRPGLGPSFGHLVDVQLYLHQIPSRKPTEAEKAGKVAEMVNILEVVQDTVGLRYGRWAPFTCEPDGRVAEVS